MRISLLALPLALMGCGQPAGSAPTPSQAPPPPPPAVTAQPVVAAVDPVAEANTIFSTRCMPCHGATGGGDGPASAGLTPKPANFKDAEWQKKVTDEHIEKIITYGGLAVGKSAAMPPNPDLDSKPEIIKALRAHIRGLGAK